MNRGRKECMHQRSPGGTYLPQSSPCTSNSVSWLNLLPWGLEGIEHHHPQGFVQTSSPGPSTPLLRWWWQRQATLAKGSDFWRRRGERGSEDLNLKEISLVGAQHFETQERAIQTPGAQKRRECGSFAGELRGEKNGLSPMYVPNTLQIPSEPHANHRRLWSSFSQWEIQAQMDLVADLRSHTAKWQP